MELQPVGCHPDRLLDLLDRSDPVRNLEGRFDQVPVVSEMSTMKMAPSDLDDFVTCARERKETERFRRFTCDEQAERDKLNMDIYWLEDDSLPEPDGIALLIVENSKTAFGPFRRAA